MELHTAGRGLRALPVWLALIVTCTGCQPTARDLSLDPAAARMACEMALLAWQDGKQPADLKPEITVGDRDWKAGQKLIAYEFVPEDEMNDGTNLHIPVRLTLQDANGRESTSEVLYIVGTSPVITVIRD
jgi:hypothetical protein